MVVRKSVIAVRRTMEQRQPDLAMRVVLSTLVLLLVSSPAHAQAPGAAVENRTIEEISAAFRTPPDSFGEVAFYWWVGDTLTRERISWQLDQLQGKGVIGLQVNYAHTDSGGLLWGLSMPSQPRLFSEEWWDLFGWFMGEAKRRGMAVSLSDYTLGVGQGSYVDEALSSHPEANGSELKSERRFVNGSTRINWTLPAAPLSAAAFRVGKDSLPVAGTRLDLLSRVRGGVLSWTAPPGAWMVFCVWAERVIPSLDPMHAVAGKAYIDHFFGRFADRFPGEAGSGINYFFSDELSFHLRYPLWNDAFAAEFRRRKGYDIRPLLDALFLEAGPATPRIRLDYNDVLVALSEENFFRPLYQWHQDRGMTFGCDHGGRGKDVAEFGDYFRTQKWNQGPGCDQPFLMQDIVKNKVASSIAHLYERPRVWLEGFHSSGWGTSTAALTAATFGNFVMGQNLLTLHGLYYTTHGGWWEWAPPCNHFRMPYWKHIDPFMTAIRRLSYLLSQGVHRCDVAVLYPVEPVVAGMGGEAAVAAAFAAAESLYNAGIDFDFMDYESLARSKVANGRLAVAGEEYRVVVLPSMKAIRYASLEKARDFVASGGIVVNIGSVPAASERGRGDPDFDRILAGLFGDTSAVRPSSFPLRSNDRGGAVFQAAADDSLVRLLGGLFARDFEVRSFPAGLPPTPPRVMHRKIAGHEVYAVYNLPEGTECFFRSTGPAEVWDPWTGERRPLHLARPFEGGTIVRLPLSRHDVQLIVFGPGRSETYLEATTLARVDSLKEVGGILTLWGEANAAGHAEATVRRGGRALTLTGKVPFAPVTRTLAGEWDFEVQPVLDNRWGDFHWPPTPELIGPEVRRMAYKAHGVTSVDAPDGPERASWDTVSCGYGPQFWKLGPIPEMVWTDSLPGDRPFDPRTPVMLRGIPYKWEPYEYSWRWGVEGDPGHQGYHGLKEVVHNDFIRLGKLTLDWTTTRRVPEEGGKYYGLLTAVYAPAEGEYTVRQGRVRPVAVFLNGAAVDTAAERVRLRRGANTLLLWYEGPCVTYYVVRASVGTPDQTANAGEVAAGEPLASDWYCDAGLLRFDSRFMEDSPSGTYRFASAPGMRRMRFAAHGDIDVRVEGADVRLHRGASRPDGAVEYLADLDRPVPRSAVVSIDIRHEPGWYGGAAIPDPVKLECGAGRGEIGDWSRNDALYAYSGGVRYGTTVTLNPDEARQSITLDLGSVVSTAEVWVNGVPAGLRVAPPWRFTLSGLVREGANSIDVLVYNTAANHYTSIPTRYRGDLTSGILGPVTLTVSARAVLTER